MNIKELYDIINPLAERIEKLENENKEMRIAIERIWAFAQATDCDQWQLCRLDICKLKDYEITDLFKLWISDN